jgi:hypothetical protein
LEGDFQLTHPGTYHVQVTSHGHIGRYPAAATPRTRQDSIQSPLTEVAVPVTQLFVLVIMPQDDASLLVREHQLAAAAETEILRATDPMRSGRATARDSQFREESNALQVLRGLAAQPVAGLETDFEHWLTLSIDFESDAITGLTNLNTPASCAALATIARTPDRRGSQAQERAAAALRQPGDRRCPP